MTDADVSVSAQQPRGWNQTLLQPKVWIPAAGGAVVLAVVIAVIATGADAEPGSTPSATPSVTPSATASPSPSVSPSASLSPSPSASPSASPSPTDDPVEWSGGFPLPGSPDEGTIVANFGVLDSTVFQPVISPDGTKVIAGTLGAEQPHYFVGPLDGSALKQLSKASYSPSHVPAWSRDSSRIAYLSDASGGPALTIANADGTGATVIGTVPDLTGDGGIHSATLSWSADGTTVAVTRSFGGGSLADSRVFLFRLADGHLTTIKGAGGAAFAPTGGALAYYRVSSSGKVSVVVGDGLGGDATTLHSVAGESWSTWSQPVVWAPDGSRIAYRTARTVDGPGEWHAITPSGDGDVKLTGKVDGGGAWSPDSEHFVAWDVGKSSAYVVSADGSGLTKLPVPMETVSWAGPTTLAFTLDGNVGSYDVVTGENALGAWFQSTSHTYSVAPSGVGVLAVADMDAGTGSISVHTP